ncbi:hypothetical protein Tco_0954779 [Tanacetum coccineum]|uniref:DOG1 domain-containing protein n=1 Tax=Tanacetum coccineum TaxID=301880 RepID=A0ABQ5E5E5_9ASTR
MAGEGPANMIARRVNDDLISFSGETAPPRFMKFFLVQKVAESRRFVNRMHDEAATARDCVAQLTALIVELQSMEDQEEVHDSLLAAKDAKRVKRLSFIYVWMLDVDVAHPLGVVFGDIIIGKVAESHRLPDKMKVAFDQARKEEASFAALMHELCCSLRVSLCKKRMLAAELEGLREQGDAVRALENMKDIVTCDSVTLGDLEQLLARAQVGVDLKDGYVADLEEKV